MTNGKQLIWHPYTQMQTAGTPLNIVKGEGAWLIDDKGQRYLDAVSSWWTNIHGHSHPYIAQKIYEQAQQLEQVIFAGFTHPSAELLAEKLLQRIPFHHKIFYSDNGSTAVEVALKMALQYWWNKEEQRDTVFAFRNAYHGDTFGAMSVSGRGLFTEPFHDLLFDIVYIDTPIGERADNAVAQLQNLLLTRQNRVAAFIFEPLVLGSGGMLMYDAGVLDKLISICKDAGVLTIADEVMTGFGRTGKFLATDYCSNKPDIICLSKGITGGFLPFAATTCTDEIYNAFLSSEKAKMFFHGHSYTGNPLGCAAGLASLEVFEQEKTMQKVETIQKLQQRFTEKLIGHKNVKHARCTGTIAAVEIETGSDTGYLNTIRDRAYEFFIQRKIILRPLGNVVYILPPYCITADEMALVQAAIIDFLNSL